MKVDTIKKKISKKNGATHFARGLRFKPYHVLFIIALIGVFFLNGLNTASRIMTLKDQVTYAAIQGYNEFIMNLESQDDFSKAKQYFVDARSTLNEIINDEELMSSSTVISDIDSLLQISVNITDSASLLLEAKGSLDTFMEQLDEKKDLGAVEEKIDKAITLMNESVSIFEGIHTGRLKLVMSGEQYKYLEELQEGVYKLQDTLTSIKENIHPLFILLGDRYPHRVLLLLQNNNEIRPSGGFIGSLGFIDLNDGRIEKIDVRDVYDFDGIGIEREPTREIAMVAGNNWGIRDSNTSPHFPTSAAQAKKFLEEARGPGVDTVVAIDLEFIRRIMEVTGPIYIKEFDLPLKPESFDLVLSYFIESKHFGEHAPKRILKYFVQHLQEAVFTQMEPKELFELIAENVTEKHIQAYSDDETLQAWFSELGMAGTLAEIGPYHDYLNVVHVSIGGNKSDAFMHQALKHETFISKDGTLLNQLTIKRTHDWNSGTDAWMLRELRKVGVAYPDSETVRILGKDTNRVMTRVYVPYGSTLKASIGISEDEIEVMEELLPNGQKFTYFWLPMNTAPGESTEIMLAYEPPFKLDFNSKLLGIDDYRLFLDKQAGIREFDFEKYMYYGPHLISYAHNPTFTEESENEVYRAVIHTDKILSIAVGEE
jgi:hypothetical protein